MFGWFRGLRNTLTDFREDPLEDHVAGSMFSDAKKLSDFIGFLVRSVFCGFAATLLYKRFRATNGDLLDAFGALFFAVLGVAMYTYAIHAMNDFVHWRLRLANKKRSALVGLGTILLAAVLGQSLGQAIFALAEKAVQ